jgi:dihydrofolate reductase
MAKLFLFMMTSVDGYFEGKDHDLSWHHTDEEFNKFAIEQTSSIGTILFGRVTYEMMASFWPTDQAKDDPETAKLMNETPKIVFSKSLASAEWHNTILKKEVDPDEVNNLKESSKKNIAVFGSSDLCVSLLEMGLLDELRIMINPVILGEGKILLAGLKKKLSLQLTQKRLFTNGNILLYYQVVK